MSLYQAAWAFAGVVLQCMVVSAMLRGSWRRYPFVFSYTLFSILSTVVQTSVLHYYGRDSRLFARAYWTLDFVSTCLVLMVIIHLIRAAMTGHPQRNTVYLGLLLGVALTAAGGLLLTNMVSRGFLLGRWMTEVSRNYYFSAVLLNVILWMTLVRRSHDNPQVYLLTSGLGLKLTGAAIAHALRLAGTPLWLGNHFLVLTYMLSLYVWYVALKKVPAPIPVPAEEPTDPRLWPTADQPKH